MEGRRLTYNDFLDYDVNQLDYSIRERSGYDEAITELIENKLFIEGTHYQTKNDYYIYVYYRGPENRYDKLIGFLKTSSKELF